MHIINVAKSDISTWRNQFVSGLSGTNKMLPMYLWEKLLDQVQTTLYMLRLSRRNPKTSGHKILEGTFDYNRTHLAPPGTKVIVHNKPNRSRTWVQHGVQGYYIGPKIEHYRCYKVFISNTRAE